MKKYHASNRRFAAQGRKEKRAKGNQAFKQRLQEGNRANLFATPPCGLVEYTMSPKASGVMMFVQGSGCSIVIKTTHCEMDVPYSSETLREAVSFLQEEAAIEGDGVCRGIRKKGGVTGCVVTSLMIGTAPLLLNLAMGSAGKAVFVSESRNLYRQELNLLPMEDTEYFDLIQDRGNERRLFEGCRVEGFELRVMRAEAVKLKMDLTSEYPPLVFFDKTALNKSETAERFNGDNVTYKINGHEYKNIYGITLLCKKHGGTITELWIKRALDYGGDLPEIIEDMEITAQLLTDNYGTHFFGTFRITLKRLVLVSDETEVNAFDTVIGPLRYYVAGGVKTDVYASGD